ncbi:MAG: 4Fe-4S dicluster domain-containing protein [Ruminococcaceae bacterium]|nr:4Fe-4S dicluster domain-containing protein [Oscillospiraceae bacterium]
MSTFTHSVYLDADKCKGCINCIKRCPTGAIRVRGGKAHIIKEFCIDCGECVRVCPHHAKKTRYDSLDTMNEYKYKVALPAPSFYAQFNNVTDTGIILKALIKLGFDDVFEVAAAAEMVSEMSRKYIAEHPEGKPYISTACPSILRLIRVRFPELIDRMLPIIAPVDLAARLAVKEAIEKTGLKREDIGIFFISPCPAKVTAVDDPLGIDKSEIDRVLAIKKVYTALLPHMKHDDAGDTEYKRAGRIGISWGLSGGEVGGLLTDSYIAADGIENVINVLEDLEDSKINNVDFIELNSCTGGCVGGVLQVENPYVAKTKLKLLRKYMPIAGSHLDDKELENAFWTKEVEFIPVFRLGSTPKESMEMMQKIDELAEALPGLDCGSCGAPSCRALAEDIIRGVANERDCIHLLKRYLHKISSDLNSL